MKYPHDMQTKTFLVTLVRESTGSSMQLIVEARTMNEAWNNAEDEMSGWKVVKVV